ncbi:stearoyl-CoA desaturase 5-like [Patiria miniata]|uniref:Fatty acid desaturase domain-containing protein n=1 Tax=Patiria miniata TaxID=46514 RepID=A0A914A8J2_PATMI|nr:stearoyl-CoA desaturase 5-like [Patiria miniata]XP_038060166.1 stearoyl-CoA desaturase 5-like [Patiria miniata]XP_038060167.1 stearoyl-CoA desaturase 5-like [Patiria miniata]
MAPKNPVYGPVEVVQDEGSAPTEDDTVTATNDDDPDMPATAEVPPRDVTAKSQPGDAFKDRTRIVWRNVVLMAALHVISVYAFLFLTWKCRPYTLLFAVGMYVCSGLGITAGAHRLWAHRCYKAKLPLRLLLAMFNCMAFQNDIYDWSRDHRVHHKYSETDADPHNATRGFFFSHVGWLLVRKHPKVIEKGSRINLRDLIDDPVVRYQRKYYLPLVTFFCFVMPTIVPMYLWGESFWNAFCVPTVLRYCFLLNCTWMVNSAAHLWGSRPYDRFINPAENRFVASLAIGEGWHNYHHTFPWDYKAGEWGWRINFTTIFIDLMAAIGQVSDRKIVPKATISARKKRTGSQVAAVGCD